VFDKVITHQTPIFNFTNTMETLLMDTTQDNIHAFSISGLGNAPFSHCSASHNLAIKNTAFYCEHCGTMLKNRHFIMSADGKVSVVGIDCLRKTGDSGLINATNAAIKESKALIKQASQQSLINRRVAQERKFFNGKTKEESCRAILEKISEVKESAEDKIDDLEITPILTKSNFGICMLELAIGEDHYTKGMINSMIEIGAKHLSGVRKNSTNYKAKLPAANALVTELCNLSNKQQKKLISLFDERNLIHNTVIR
jgi:hypothetical protein